MDSHNTENPPQDEDLNTTLGNLNASVETAMVSLYNIQLATINANGENLPRHSERYREIRTNLKEQWEAIIDLLKKCHSFGADVKLLTVHMATASKEELEELLEEMADKVKACAMMALGLVDGYDGVIAVYYNYKRYFELHLERSIMAGNQANGHGDPFHVFSSTNSQQPDVPPLPPRRNSYKNSEQSHAPSATPPGAKGDNPSHPMSAFINQSIESLYPDGKKAISDFESSLNQIYSQLEPLPLFLEIQYQICNQCIDGMKTPTQALKLDDIQNLATKWTTYQTDIMNSIISIAKICDAIMVEAATAPPPPPPRKQVPAPENNAQGHEKQAPGDRKSVV